MFYLLTVLHRMRYHSYAYFCFFFFSSRRRHTRSLCDWSSDVCSSDLARPAAARRRVRKTRAWAAPQVEHAGQVLQDSVAPKVSALLSAAARRLEPAKPQDRKSVV